MAKCRVQKKYFTDAEVKCNKADPLMAKFRGQKPWTLCRQNFYARDIASK